MLLNLQSADYVTFVTTVSSLQNSKSSVVFYYDGPSGPYSGGLPYEFRVMSVDAQSVISVVLTAENQSAKPSSFSADFPNAIQIMGITPYFTMSSLQVVEGMIPPGGQGDPTSIYPTIQALVSALQKGAAVLYYEDAQNNLSIWSMDFSNGSLIFNSVAINPVPSTFPTDFPGAVQLAAPLRPPSFAGGGMVLPIPFPDSNPDGGTSGYAAFKAAVAALKGKRTTVLFSETQISSNTFQFNVYSIDISKKLAIWTQINNNGASAEPSNFVSDFPNAIQTNEPIQDGGLQGGTYPAGWN